MSIDIKIDDTLISLINDYHSISHSEIISYFGTLCEHSLKCEANIMNDKKTLTSGYSKKQGKMLWFTRQINPCAETNHVWVLRGFYPDTKIPFKMSIVMFKQFGSTEKIYSCKVLMGNKTSITPISLDIIKEYNERVAEATLLDTLEDVKDIEYKVKPFKCMRPKGMPLLKKKE